jgi:hypothetical protein
VDEQERERETGDGDGDGGEVEHRFDGRAAALRAA